MKVVKTGKSKRSFFQPTEHKGVFNVLPTAKRLGAEVIFENFDHPEEATWVTYIMNFTSSNGQDCSYAGSTDDLKTRLSNHLNIASWDNSKYLLQEALADIDQREPLQFFIKAHANRAAAKKEESDMVRQLKIDDSVKCLNIVQPNPEATAARRAKIVTKRRKKNSRSRPMIAFKDGVVAMFDSVTECCRTLNLEVTNVNAILLGYKTKSGGYRTTSNGWRFSYVNEKKQA